MYAKVHPNALLTAGKLSPRTPLEGKFSVPFCISLGLRGYRAVATDFNDATFRDASVMAVVPVVELEAVQGQSPHSAHLDVYLEGGEKPHADTDVVIGYPDNTMQWDDLHAKFQGLTEPILGSAKAEELYGLLREFERPGTLTKVMSLLSGAP